MRYFTRHLSISSVPRPRWTTAFKIVKRDGLAVERLTPLPIRWSDRRFLAFRTKKDAEAAIREHLAIAKKLLGVRVERA